MVMCVYIYLHIYINIYLYILKAYSGNYNQPSNKIYKATRFGTTFSRNIYIYIEEKLTKTLGEKSYILVLQIVDSNFAHLNTVEGINQSSFIEVITS